MIKPFRVFALVLLLAFGLMSAPLFAAGEHGGDYDENRAKLLGYLLRQQLNLNHYSHKAIDDEFSRAAFHLYIKQLDGQKRFLLQEDVERLQVYAPRIDDELNDSKMKLPAVSSDLLDQRIGEARQIVRDLLAEDFDFQVKEEVETDPEKLDFAKDRGELRERWRKMLKLQVLNRYLELQEDQEAEKDAAAGAADREPVTQALAREKVGKTYESFFSRVLEETEQDHYDRYFNAVTRAFDPHTNYLPPAEKEDFDISMSGSLEGIGATLREEDGYIKVVAVIPGSAAWRQGELEAEDIILKVAEGQEEPVDITDTRIRDAVALIRGKKGTEVRLTVRKPDGTGLVIPITRDVVQIEETFARSTVIEDEKTGRSFGYIKIPSFYRDFSGGSGRNVTDDVKGELDKLKKANVNGVILDLRNNGGGALTDAVGVAGLFIETGPVVQIRSAGGKINVLTDDDPDVAYDGPVAVLVNQFSASASEILAGALQDYGRAVVIGAEHTHGKGTVQAIVDLDRSVPFVGMDKYRPLGALKVTIQKFYRVSGDSTQYRGVEPDIVLPDRMQHLKTGEKHMDYSLPWDTIAATDYALWQGDQPDRAALRARSAQRLSKDADFIDIVAEASKATERSENTRQSLLIDDLRRDREEFRKTADASPHGESGDEERKGNLSAQEKRKQWEKEVREDPYASEAVSVLQDWLSLSAPATAGGDISGASAAVH